MGSNHSVLSSNLLTPKDTHHFTLKEPDRCLLPIRLWSCMKRRSRPRHPDTCWISGPCYTKENRKKKDLPEIKQGCMKQWRSALFQIHTFSLLLSNLISWLLKFSLLNLLINHVSCCSPDKPRYNPGLSIYWFSKNLPRLLFQTKGSQSPLPVGLSLSNHSVQHPEAGRLKSHR